MHSIFYFQCTSYEMSACDVNKSISLLVSKFWTDVLRRNTEHLLLLGAWVPELAQFFRAGPLSSKAPQAEMDT
jgi:hypothetical protein